MKSGHRHIAYLSAPMQVNWAIGGSISRPGDHFWIRCRFDVMRPLADSVIRNAKCAAEIGCGNGLLQRNGQTYYGIPVTAFELNEVAPQKNVSRLSPLHRHKYINAMEFCCQLLSFWQAKCWEPVYAGSNRELAKVAGQVVYPGLTLVTSETETVDGLPRWCCL